MGLIVSQQSRIIGPAAGYAEGTSKEGFYWKAGSSYDEASPSGFSAIQAGKVCLLSKVEVKSVSAPVSTRHAAHTTDAAQLSLSSAEDIMSITVNTEEYKTSPYLLHAVSFDGRQTFWMTIDAGTTWRQIVRNLGGTQWQYQDNSEVWQNAASNTLIRALRDAFSETDNQMTSARLEEVTDWGDENDTGWVPLFTQTMNFAFCLLRKSTTQVPTLSGYTVTTQHSGLAQMEAWSGSSGWQAGDGWTDGTGVDGLPLAQDGAITYNGSSPAEAEYAVFNGQPGYWWRLNLLQGTSSDCAITRIQYKGPCQELANVGDGLERICAEFMYNGINYTQEVATPTYTDNSCAWLCDDPDAGSPTAMGTSDWIWVLSPLPFNQLRIKVHPTHYNENTAVLSAYYWSSSGEWTSINIEDTTKGSGDATLAEDGTISWTIPDDWDEYGVLTEKAFQRGYWMGFRVSAQLTAPCGIVEARLYDIPETLKKQRHCTVARDRVFLGSPPHAPDQVQASLELKEHGWHGDDTYTIKVGGTDAISGIFTANNDVYVAKPNELYALGADFNFYRQQVTEPPINSRVVVAAPTPGSGSDSKEGLYWLNHRGAHLYAGLQADQSYASGRWKKISDTVNWWSESALPRIDLDYLHNACGVYWPRENWVIWAVPMTSDGSAQTTNNYLLVYDCTHGAWLPPFDIPVSALCTGYYYNSNAPGKLGQLGIFAGNYSGQILALFTDTDDAGSEISSWVETGWLDFGAPEIRKILRTFTILGNTEAASGNITLTVYSDGVTGSSTPYTYSECDEVAGTLAHWDFKDTNKEARFFKFKIEGAGPTEIHAVSVEVHPVGMWSSVPNT